MCSMKILERLNHNTVSFNRPIAHALGLAAAVVYSALIAKQVYYEQRDMLDSEGWFYSTIADLEESTSLSKRQQSGAIKALIDAGLVECQKRGMPARRYFRVRDDVELVNEILAQGEDIMTDLNPISQKLCENVPTSCPENVQQVGAFCNDKSVQNEPYTYNPNKKSKEKNPYQSIIRDGIDMMDFPTKSVSFGERNDYLALIRENIDYDCFTEKEKVDELVGIMLDVVCSTNDTVRVNVEDMPQRVVKSRFLKLNYEHIDYVLTSMQKNTSNIHNIRAYLITALYNAPETMDSYYTAWVNHNMRGGA